MSACPRPAHWRAAIGTCMGIAALVLIPRSGWTQSTDTSRDTPPNLAATLMIDALETSRHVLVGRIGQVRKLDLHGYSGSIWSEALLGETDDDFEPGTPTLIAWEELSQHRPPRFANHDRLLACVEKLPTASLWRKRLPEPSQRRQTQAIAADGECYVRDPSEQDIAFVDQYLRLSPASRASEQGVAILLSLAERGDPRLALAAATKLGTIEDLAEDITDDGADQLVVALLREDATGDLGRAVLRTASLRGGERLADALERARDDASDAKSMPPPRLFEALATVTGTLPERAEEQLLERPEAAYRAVAARYASQSDAPATLRNLIASDPAPAVRAAAIRRLAAILGDDALPTLVGALEQPDSVVRNTAARTAGALGESGIRALRDVLLPAPDAPRDQGAMSGDAQRAALGGLSAAGRPGRKVLVDVARSHPDESMRRLAKLALGVSNTEGH